MRKVSTFNPTFTLGQIIEMASVFQGLWRLPLSLGNRRAPQVHLDYGLHSTVQFLSVFLRVLYAVGRCIERVKWCYLRFR